MIVPVAFAMSSAVTEFTPSEPITITSSPSFTLGTAETSTMHWSMQMFPAIGQTTPFTITLAFAENGLGYPSAYPRARVAILAGFVEMYLRP